MIINQLFIAGYSIPALTIDRLTAAEVLSSDSKKDISAVPPYQNKIALSTLKSFLEANRQEDCVLLLSADHVPFHIQQEQQQRIIEMIVASVDYGAKILLGNAAEVGQCIPLTDNMGWIDKFSGTSFTVIFSPLFETIIADPLDACDDLWEYLSEITSQKLIFIPFLPVQAEKLPLRYQFTEAKISELFFIKERFGLRTNNNS